jgi:hypothetical protein
MSAMSAKQALTVFGQWRYSLHENAIGNFMNVDLTPELEALVQGKIESGRYNSPSEVVREALRLLEQRKSGAL